MAGSSDDTKVSSFLDRKSRRTAQSTTKLLCALDNALQRRSTSKSARFGVQKTAKIYQKFIHTHLNLLLRGNEDIAAVTSTPRLLATNSLNEEIRLKDQELSSRFEQEITSSKIDIARNNKPDPNIIGKLLKNVKKNANGCIDFDDHVCSYFQYVREVNSAEDIAQFDASVMRLRTYIYSNCYPKILQRLESGSKKTRDGYTPNFWEVLTTDITSMPEHVKAIPVPTRFRDKMPNRRQSALIRIAFGNFRSVSENVFHNRTVYQTKSDRFRFQHMLRTYLLGAYQALDELKNAMKNPAEAEESHIELLVRGVNRYMVWLWKFLIHFEDFLETHLKWLAASYKVTSFKDKAIWPDPKESAVSDRDALATATAEEETSDSTTNDQETPMTAKSVDAASTDESTDLEDEDAYDDDLDKFVRVQNEAERAQREAREYDTYKTWALGAIAYMRRACLHEEKLRRVTAWPPGSRQARDRFEPAHIKEAKISVVKIMNARSDDERPKIDIELINRVKKFRKAGHFGHLDAEYLLPKLGDLTASAIVSTTPHCEAILMSLITIAKDRQTMKHVTDDWLKSKSILISRNDLLHMFPSIIPGVLASRPSCWLCEAVREQMISLDITKLRVFAPNSQVSCPLPEIKPKKLADPVYEHIMRECAGELQEWQNRQKLLQIQEEERQITYRSIGWDSVDRPEPRPLRKRIKVSTSRDAYGRTEIADDKLSD